MICSMVLLYRTDRIGQHWELLLYECIPSSIVQLVMVFSSSSLYIYYCYFSPPFCRFFVECFPPNENDSLSGALNNVYRKVWISER